MHSAAMAPVRQSVGSEPTALNGQWDLVLRVATSSTFRKSRRLRDLLLFVGERALREPGVIVREQQIGTAVFGRPAEFDSSQDTLVRVQASQLRKRLRFYFAGEGAAEPVIIDIPKGSYVPVFRERERPAVPAQEAPPAPRPSTIAAPRSSLLALAAALAVAVVACVWLAVENRGMALRLEAGLGAQPTVDLLWRQLFANGRKTYLVLADANLTMYQDLIQRQLSPSEYQRQDFRALADKTLTDPASRILAWRLMNRQFTSLADTELARRLSLLNAAHGVPTDIVLARNAGPDHFKSHNAVLSGSRRSNPWMALWEEKLNFRSRFDEHDRQAYIDNARPLPGEQRTYAVDWQRTGYCRVAYVPNLDGTGSLLLLSGTDMPSSEAGAEFITSERWVRRLREVLGVQGRLPVPHFEALLRTQLIVGEAPGFELIAWRKVIHPAGS